MPDLEVSNALGHYLLTGALGAAFGASELLSRYRDAPRQLLGLLSTWVATPVPAP